MNPFVFAAIISIIVLAGACTLFLSFRRKRSSANLEHPSQTIKSVESEPSLLTTDPNSASSPSTMQKLPQEEGEETREMAELEAVYRRALLADPRITRFQILGMGYSLDLAHVFIQVRLCEEKAGAQVEAELFAAIESDDPQIFLQSRQQTLEQDYEGAVEAAEKLSQARRWLIMGDPGTGKTTLLKFLALHTANHEIHLLPDLPIYVELGAFATSRKQDLLEYIADSWEQRYSIPQQQAYSHIQYRLQTGRALLLLDGLDETVIGETELDAEGTYRQVIQSISAIEQSFPEIRIIITSRKANYNQRKAYLKAHLSGDFRNAEIVQFRQVDIEQFIDNWLGQSPSSYKAVYIAELKTYMRQNPSFCELAGNPLLLSLIVQLFERGVSLPDQRSDLYKRCVETLLNRWDVSRDIRRRHTIQHYQTIYLLQRIAWHIHRERKFAFPKDALLNLIEELLPAIELSSERSLQVLREITENCGLLKEQGDNTYSFLHLTFQEYFASCHALENDQDQTTLAFLFQNRSDIWWKEVILLYVGQVRDASQWLQLLLDSSQQQQDDDDDLILAGNCLADRPRITDHTLRDKTIMRLFELLQQAESSITRFKSATALTHIGGDSINRALSEMLQSPSINSETQSSIEQAMREAGTTFPVKN